MHIPSADGNLHKPGALVSLQHLFSDDAGVAKAIVPVAHTVIGAELERLIDNRIVGELLGRRIERVHVLGAFAERAVDAQRIVEAMEQAPAVF